ncbi:MAG: TauD/TfdA family dioxygenase [Acidimicrobiia bacterium]|nr:TauD/TfdA family dioxygenase [Acidimicrobiia bacterium]MDH5291148.1 TauD/TfdA family dioxygenase [Acidimicrobiia bacterium]
MDVHRQPITDRSAWTGADLRAASGSEAADARSWEITLDDAARAELADALARVTAAGLPLSRIDRRAFALPGLAATLATVRDELRTGRGFVLLRGFPVDGYDFEAIEKLYWGFCSHLGVGMTQNSDASLIHYVTDGVLRPNQGKRGVGSPLRSSLHVDLTDVVSLLCVRQAPDNPPSWVASSTEIHNRILARHPEAMEAFYQGFEWDRLEEHGEGETPTTGYRVPVFSQADGHVSCRYNRYWMASAFKRRHGEVPAEAQALFDLFDATADEIRLEVDFQPGDVQFVNNYTVLHGRAAHDEIPEETRKRVLMRIWLDFEGQARPMADEALVRYGVVRHGALGWTVDQLNAGAHRGRHVRQPDGRPVVAVS